VGPAKINNPQRQLVLPVLLRKARHLIFDATRDPVAMGSLTTPCPNVTDSVCSERGRVGPTECEIASAGRCVLCAVALEPPNSNS